MNYSSPRHKNKYPLYFFSVLFLTSFLLFLPGFSMFFHQDDFIHMMYSRTFEQVIGAFNLFSPGEFPFYRPIPTQIYFFFFGKLFGLQPLGYHAVNFLIYFINVLLVFRLGSMLTGRWRVGAIAGLIYAINSTHTAPLFSAAYVHELLYVCFGLLTVITYLQFLKNQRSLVASCIFFVLALMTKENAVILPGILYLLTGCHRFSAASSNPLKMRGSLYVIVKQSFAHLLPFIIILAVYLYGHFVHYGVAVSSSYSVIVGKATIQILLWYFLWALSVPNILIDFLEPGLRLRSVFFSIAGTQANIFLTSFFLLLIVLGITGIWVMVKAPIKTKLTVLLGLLWFITAMIPLLPFPLHHLATEQAFALVGLAITIGVIIDTAMRRGGWFSFLSFAFLLVYLVHASNTIILAQKTHWIVRSSQQAQRVIKSLQTDPPIVTAGKTLVFLDGEIKIPEYGSSRQIYEALGNGAAIPLYFGEGISQLYEFKDDMRRDDVSQDRIILDSSRFLGY